MEMLSNWNFIGTLFSIQAEELRKALYAKDVPAKVYVGMRYWHPFTEEAIEQVSWYDFILIFDVPVNDISASELCMS